MARNEQLGISTNQAFEVGCPVELAVAAYLRRSQEPHALLPMVLRTETETESCSTDGSGCAWNRRTRRFFTSSDLPHWLAPLVGSAGEVVIREDARWRVDGATLELYTENVSHRAFLRVQEWCTFEPCSTSAEPRTLKRLHVRAGIVRHWWFFGLSQKLEAFLLRRYLESLKLGLAVDEVIRGEMLAEGTAAHATRHLSLRDPCDATPPPPPPPPRPCMEEQAMAPAAAARSPARSRPQQQRKRNKPVVLPFLAALASGAVKSGIKVASLALLARALPLALALRR